METLYKRSKKHYDNKKTYSIAFIIILLYSIVGVLFKVCGIIIYALFGEF
jgi:hypothetical protein